MLFLKKLISKIDAFVVGRPLLDSFLTIKCELEKDKPITKEAFVKCEEYVNKIYEDRIIENTAILKSKIETSKLWKLYAEEKLKAIENIKIGVEEDANNDMESICAPRVYLWIHEVEENKINKIERFEIFNLQHNESENSMVLLSDYIRRIRKKYNKTADMASA
jgi:hypothetical protein